MEEEYHAMVETFPTVQQGHLFKFLQGFQIDEKCVHYFEDETSDLDAETLQSFKKFLKTTRSACFKADIAFEKIQSRIFFFLQKLSELADLGFPVRTERR
jgi:hypothetical protein